VIGDDKLVAAKVPGLQYCARQRYCLRRFNALTLQRFNVAMASSAR